MTSLAISLMWQSTRLEGPAGVIAFSLVIVVYASLCLRQLIAACRLDHRSGWRTVGSSHVKIEPRPMEKVTRTCLKTNNKTYCQTEGLAACSFMPFLSWTMDCSVTRKGHMPVSFILCSLSCFSLRRKTFFDDQPFDAGGKQGLASHLPGSSPS
jgi:hypothetical protein